MYIHEYLKEYMGRLNLKHHPLIYMYTYTYIYICVHVFICIYVYVYLKVNTWLYL